MKTLEELTKVATQLLLPLKLKVNREGWGELTALISIYWGKNDEELTVHLSEFSHPFPDCYRLARFANKSFEIRDEFILEATRYPSCIEKINEFELFMEDVAEYIERNPTFKVDLLRKSTALNTNG